MFGLLDPASDATPYAIAFVLLTLIIVLFTAWLLNGLRSLWYAVPLQVRALRPLAKGKKAKPIPTDIDLQAAIVAFLDADPLRRLVPGSMQWVEPRIMARASFTPWVELLVLAWSVASRRPAYVVTLDQLSLPDSEKRWSVVARVSRQPGGRVVAAQTFHGVGAELAEQVGSFALHRVRQQRYVQRRTPPWERWWTDEGYLEYRRGLQARARGLELRATWKAQVRQVRQREAEQARGGASDEWAEHRYEKLPEVRDQVEENKKASEDYLAKALTHFGRAIRHDRQNVAPKLAAASVRELVDEYWTAIGLYTACRDQWPELAEPAYRLLALVDKRDPRPTGLECRERADRLLAEVEQALSRPNLFRLWMRGKGYRRHVRGLRAKPRVDGVPSRIRKRRLLLLGARATRLTVLMWNLTERKHGDDRGLSLEQAKEAVRSLFREQAVILGVGRRAAVKALLHGGGRRRTILRDPDSHDALGHERVIKTITHVDATRRRDRLGWLAHYNAACFFAFASKLPDDLLPWKTSRDVWVQDCVAAASRQIRRVFGDPTSDLDPNWIDDDPDLVPVWDAIWEESMPREIKESMRWMLG